VITAAKPAKEEKKPAKAKSKDKKKAAGDDGTVYGAIVLVLAFGMGMGVC